VLPQANRYQEQTGLKVATLAPQVFKLRQQIRGEHFNLAVCPLNNLLHPGTVRASDDVLLEASNRWMVQPTCVVIECLSLVPVAVYFIYDVGQALLGKHTDLSQQVHGVLCCRFVIEMSPRRLLEDDNRCRWTRPSAVDTPEALAQSICGRGFKDGAR
jgi:hypothetical protein